MKRTLVLSGVKNDSKIHEGFHEIIQAFQKPNPAYQITLANRLYCQKGFKHLSDFLQTTRKQYLSDVKSVQFKKDGSREKTRKKINCWVEKVGYFSKLSYQSITRQFRSPMTKSKIQLLKEFSLRVPGWSS